ncbi:hypothetical protein LX95_01522 [Mesonia algae]|uniref:Lipoprotein n=1 Tax=Mesonia algae TaxID=213248 RepID=A0A2W7I2T4_9FLAO|nr:hypothetical protein [Mesonia algae]PZW40459.1 hypothetical protein LX95_01522 [Mesonia algae]
MIKKIILLFTIIAFTSCESEADKKKREAKEEQQRIEIEAQHQQEAEELAFQEEKDRIERERREEIERIKREAELEAQRKKQELYDKYINKSLYTGSTPYSYCFGRNKSCSSYGCSQIKVRTPSNSDVVVTIKKNNKVFRHAYINAGSQYTFEFPNGTYQAFFYYGRGWNPNKVMKETDCGTLKGGFIADEHFGKDSPQSLSNNILEYELILQQNGNFSTRPSNSEEAF